MKNEKRNNVKLVRFSHAFIFWLIGTNIRNLFSNIRSILCHNNIRMVRNDSISIIFCESRKFQEFVWFGIIDLASSGVSFICHESTVPRESQSSEEHMGHSSSFRPIRRLDLYRFNKNFFYPFAYMFTR